MGKIALAIYRLKDSLWLSQERNLYNNLVEYGAPMELVRLIIMFLNVIYSKVCMMLFLFRMV
jgi:hypothetical protein